MEKAAQSYPLELLDSIADALKLKAYDFGGHELRVTMFYGMERTLPNMKRLPTDFSHHTKSQPPLTRPQRFTDYSLLRNKPV